MYEEKKQLTYDDTLLIKQHQDFCEELGIMDVSEDQRKEALRKKFTEEEIDFVAKYSDNLNSFVYPTNHLSNFDSIDKMLRLYGEEYDVIKKALWYSVFSLPIRTSIAKLGDIHVDCRFHVAFPMPSGSGKKRLIEVLSKISKSIDLSVSKPTSLHPEQLIGKIIRKSHKREATYERIRGHFADDVVAIDEATELIRSKEPSYRESRKYLNMALDPYGSNEVFKRMVDTPREEALTYYPACNVVLFFQPFWFDQEIVLIGTLRRFLIIYQTLKQNPEKSYEERVDAEGIVDDSYIDEVAARLRDIQEKISRREFTFSDGFKQRFKELHKELIAQCASHSDKARNFAHMTDYSLQDDLLKMSCIQASSRLKIQVDIEDLECAYVDLAEFLKCTLDFIDKKINGSLDYGEGWGGAKDEEAECIALLREQGAVSAETSKVSIRDFLDSIGMRFEAGIDSSRKKYYRFKRLGWIDSKQIGQHGSRVWVTAQGGQGDKATLMYPDNFDMVEYHSIVEKIRNIKGSLKPLSSSESNGQRSENDIKFNKIPAINRRCGWGRHDCKVEYEVKDEIDGDWKPCCESCFRKLVDNNADK